MRTTPAERASDRRGNDDEQVLARDNPRRRCEAHGEDDDRHGNRTNRSPLRHGVQAVRDDLRRIG